MKLVNIQKSFGTQVVLKDINVTFEYGHIYGLVGENGAGKSTLLRILSSVLEPSNGDLQIDNKSILKKEEYKKDLFFISDDPYFFPQSTIYELKQFYKAFYPNFNETIYKELLVQLQLEEKMKLHHFSKGMRRQVSFLFAFSVQPKYLILDEAFDGLDPKIRLLMKEKLIKYIMEQEAWILISSHNIRELEDLVDATLLIVNHECKWSNEESTNIYKYQIVFTDEVLDLDLHVVKVNQVGKVYTYYFKGDKTQIEETLKQYSFFVCEELELRTEEKIVFEMDQS